MTVCDRTQLADLSRPPALRASHAPLTAGGAEEKPPGGAAPLEVWRIPKPQDGTSYTAQEVSAIARVSVATVRAWVSRGLKVGAGRAKLRTLRAPRGRITPAALCRFLALVNGMPVEIEPKC